MNKLILIAIILTITCGNIFKNYDANCNYLGYLKRAADANSVEIANEELSKALSYLEENNITKGSTAILFKSPAEDVGFWYKNLKASQKELSSLAPDSSSLEKSNVLMKLRETILDSGEKGQVLTAPSGIEYFPNNGLWLLANFVLVFSILGLIFLLHKWSME